MTTTTNRICLNCRFMNKSLPLGALCMKGIDPDEVGWAGCYYFQPTEEAKRKDPCIEQGSLF